jgi:hypothetical protein
MKYNVEACYVWGVCVQSSDKNNAVTIESLVVYIIDGSSAFWNFVEVVYL